MADLIEEIRKPISEDAPCGQSILHDEDFTAVKSEIDKANTPARADVKWKKVVELSRKILAQKSKDMQVASYLCLGLLRQNGFAGLAEGLEGYLTLLKVYWDGLHTPLNRRNPIFDFLDERSSKEAGRLNISAEDGEALQKIDETITAINDEVKEKLRGNLVLLKLQQVIKTRLSVVKPKLDDEEETESQNGDTKPQFLSAATSGSIKGRAEAYRQLSEIADYLTKIEPHSPTPYLIRRAVAWGEMSLEELLKELVGDNLANLKAVYSLLGIKEQPASRNQPPIGEQPANRNQSPSKK
jgi:predicted component of type VI protein secretion system